MPPECTAYSTIMDTWRDIFAAGGSNCETTLQAGWYCLYQGLVPAYLVELSSVQAYNAAYSTPQAYNAYSRCGTDRGTVLLGASHPTVADGIVSRQMYTEYGTFGTFTEINIRNCNEQYYV